MSPIFPDDAEFKESLKKAEQDSADIERFIAEKKAFIADENPAPTPMVSNDLNQVVEPAQAVEAMDKVTLEIDHLPTETFELNLGEQRQLMNNSQVFQDQSTVNHPITNSPAAPVGIMGATGGQLKPKKKLSFGDHVNDWVRTGLYALIFFLIGYVGINYQAYYEVGTNFYYEIIGQERDSVLRTFAVDESLDTVAETLENSSTIPAFDQEIIPPGTRIILPRLGKNVPVVPVNEENLIKRDWSALENDLQSALRDGVVHYPGTPWPGQSGNVVLTGHSSYYPWDPGRFKDVFAVLHNVSVGEEIVVLHNQRKYNYVVESKMVVLPSEVNVLGDTGDDRLTMLTCTPIGTNLKRLIVTAKPV